MKILTYNISYKLFIILIILFTFSLYNFYLMKFNNINDKTNEELIKNYKYKTICIYTSWLSYLLFFVILIYINLKQTTNIYVKIILTLLFLYIIYLPILPIICVINIILYLFLNNPPFIENINEEFYQNREFELNYNKIKNEYIKYNNNNYISCLRDTGARLNNIDMIDRKKDHCWRGLYLKTAGKLDYDLYSFFPITMNLIKDKRIHNAFFSILDPKIEIKPHIGYFKGDFRYHLGIIIPDENNIKPYIICDNYKYEWKNGKGVIFDDMYIHYVNNPTNKQRVVLYLDIKRNNLNFILNLLTNIGISLIENSFIIKLLIKNDHKQNKIK